MSPLLGPDDPKKKKKKPPAPVAVAEAPFDVDAFEAEQGPDEEAFDVDAFESSADQAAASFSDPGAGPEPVGDFMTPQAPRLPRQRVMPADPTDPTIGTAVRQLQGKPRFSERGIGTEPGFLDTISATNQPVENFIRGAGAALQRYVAPEQPELTQEDREDYGIEDQARQEAPGGRFDPRLGKPELPDLDPEGTAGAAGQIGAGLGVGAYLYGAGGRGFQAAAKGTRVGTFLERLASKGVMGRAAANAIPVAPVDAVYGFSEPYPFLEEKYGKVGGRVLSVLGNVAANFGAEAALHAGGGLYHEWRMRQNGPANARLVGDTKRVAESLEDMNRVEASRMAQEAAATQGRSDLAAQLEALLNNRRTAAAAEVAAREAEIVAARSAVVNQPPSAMGNLLRTADEQLLEGQRAAGARRQNAAEEAAKAAEAEQAREALANAVRGFHEAGGAAQIERAAAPQTAFHRNYESIFPERPPTEAAAEEGLTVLPPPEATAQQEPPAGPGEPPAGAGGAAAVEPEPPAWDAHMTPIEREDLRTRVQSEPRLTEFDDDDILDARMRQKGEQQVDYSQTPEGLQKRQANVETLLDNRGEAEFEDELGHIPGRAEAPHRAGENPELHILTGSPGSGKSTIVKGLIKDEGMLGATLVDTDEGKKLIDGFDQGRGANLVHKESQAHWRELLDRSQAEGRDIIMPTVGRDQAVLERIIKRAKERGYEVFLHHVDIPKEEAGKRAVARFRDRTGKLARFVDPHYVVNEVGDAPREIHGRVKRLPELSGTRHLDNMVPRGAPPNVIEGTGRYAPTGGEAAGPRAGAGTLSEGYGRAGGGGVGEGGADATGLSAPAAPEPTAPQAPRPRIGGVEGPESRVTLADGTKYPVTFRIVEAGDIQASHDPQGFAVNPEYPEGVQGRRYHKDRAAQENVVEAAQHLDPDLLLNDTGTAEGTPVITEGGIVLSGNQRAMMLKRAAAVDIAEPGNRYEMYVQSLVDRMELMGLDPAELENFENPVLVREISAEHIDPTDVEAMQAYNLASDVSTTKAKSGLDEGQTRATKLQQSEDALNYFSQTIEPDETLRAYLDSTRGRQFLDRLVQDGVINRAELGKLLDGNNLTAEAKQLIERTMYAAAVGDPDVLERIPGKIKQKMDSAIPVIVAANGIPGYELQQPLQAALRELALVAEQPKEAGILNLAGLRAQQSMFGDPLTAAGKGLADYLEASPKNQVTEAFRRYLQGAKDAVAHGGVPDMFGAMPETPEQLVLRAFGRPVEDKGGLGRAGYIGMRAKSLEHRTWKDEVRALRFDGDDDAADALEAFMKGAEVTRPAFHGTVRDFDEFTKTADFGYHSGTADQASDRAWQKERLTAPQGTDAEGYHQANVMPVWVRGKYAEVADLGSWSPDDIVEDLVKRDYLTRDELVRLEDAANVARKKPAWGRGRDEFMQTFREVLQEAGYSGVKYRNVGEGASAAAFRRGEKPPKNVQGDERFAYAVFEPGDIKSATGNTGTFDATNPDIRGHTGLNLMAGLTLGGGGGFVAGSQVGDTPEERLRNGVLAGLAGLALGAAGGAAVSREGRGILGLQGLEAGALGDKLVPLPGRTWEQHARALRESGDREGAINLTRFMKKSKVRQVVFHGTTGDFNAFDPARGNVESDWGKGIYFTDTPADVSANYAGHGPDLTQRIEHRAEMIESEQGVEMEEARKLAAAELAGPHQGAAMPAFIKLENPAIAGGKDETRLTFEQEFDEGMDVYGEPTGTLVDFAEGVRDAGYEYGASHDEIQRVLGDLYEAGLDGDLSVVAARNIVKDSDAFLDATDGAGNIASSEIMRAGLERAGFDGVIDRTVYDKFGPKNWGGGFTSKGMAGMEAGTTHYVAFKPEQIKSATGNRGTFSPDVTDVTGAIGDQPRKGPREQPEEGGDFGADDDDYLRYEEKPEEQARRQQEWRENQARRQAKEEKRRQQEERRYRTALEQAVAGKPAAWEKLKADHQVPFYAHEIEPEHLLQQLDDPWMYKQVGKIAPLPKDVEAQLDREIGPLARDNHSEIYSARMKRELELMAERLDPEEMARHYPGDTMGWDAHQNPEATVGTPEGGHRFQVFHDEFLIDPSEEKKVYDLRDPEEQALAIERYGDPDLWNEDHQKIWEEAGERGWAPADLGMIRMKEYEPSPAYDAAQERLQAFNKTRKWGAATESPEWRAQEREWQALNQASTAASAARGASDDLARAKKRFAVAERAHRAGDIDDAAFAEARDYRDRMQAAFAAADAKFRRAEQRVKTAQPSRDLFGGVVAGEGEPSLFAEEAKRENGTPVGQRATQTPAQREAQLRKWREQGDPRGEEGLFDAEAQPADDLEGLFPEEPEPAPASKAEYRRRAGYTPRRMGISGFSEIEPKPLPEPTTPRERLARADLEHRDASQTYDEVQRRFRMGKAEDAEYLAARKVRDDALAKWEEAHAEVGALPKEKPAPKAAEAGVLNLGDLAGPDPESLPQKVKDAQKQTTMRMDTSPVRGPQGINDAVRRAELIVNDPKQAFLAKNKMPTQAYIDAKALLARGEKIGAGELTERLEELRGEEKRETPKDDGTLTLFVNPIPQVIKGIASHRLPSAAVLGTVGALLSDNDDPNIEKIGHFTMALAAFHAVGMKRLTAAGGAVGRTAVKSLARYEKGRDFVRFMNPEALIPAEVKAELKAYADLKYKGQARRAQFSKQARALGPTGDRALSDIIELEDHGEAAKLNPADLQATMDLAVGIAAEWEHVGNLKVQHEVLPQVAVDAHQGTYAGPRLYAEYEALDALGEKSGGGGPPRKSRIGAQRRRTLGSDPESMVTRHELGEIREQSVRLRGLEKAYSDIAAAKLFQGLRSIPGVVHPEFQTALDDFLAARTMWQQAKAAKDVAGQQVAEGMMQQTQNDMHAISRHFSTGQGDYVAMPDSKGLGVLRGMVVTKEVANSLNGLPDLRFTGPFMRFWKAKTTIFNLGTHMGNVMSNVTMMHMAGVPVWKQPGLLRSAAKDMVSYGAATQALAEAGVLDVNIVTADALGAGASGQVRATRKELLQQLKTGKQNVQDVLTELGLKETNWDRIKALGEKLGGPLKRLYSNEDNIFRVAYAQHATTPVSRGGLGMSMKEAVEASRKDLIDFRTRSPAIRLLAGTISPFVLYPAKAIPTFARHVIEHPWRYLGLVAAWTAVDQYSQEKVGPIDQLDLPPDQRRGWAGTALPGLTQVPFEGPGGAKGAFDIARWTPLSGLTDASPPGAATSVAFDNWPRFLSPSGPMTDIGARLVNTDPYTGQKLVPRSATPGEFGEVAAEGAADLLLPPMLGFHRRRLWEDYKSGDMSAVKNDAAGLAGLRPRYVRPGQYQQRAQYELEQALMDAKQQLRTGLRKSQRPERDEELYQQYDNRARRAQERYIDRTTAE